MLAGRRAWRAESNMFTSQRFSSQSERNVRTSRRSSTHAKMGMQSFLSRSILGQSYLRDNFHQIVGQILQLQPSTRISPAVIWRFCDSLHPGFMLTRSLPYHQDPHPFATSNPLPPKCFLFKMRLVEGIYAFLALLVVYVDAAPNAPDPAGTLLSSFAHARWLTCTRRSARLTPHHRRRYRLAGRP